MIKNSKPKLGELEELILLAIDGIGDEAYGVPIAEKLISAGREVSVGALYVTLERMEQKGFITSRQGEATPERGGRAKTFYRLAGDGQRALQQVEELRNKLKRGLPGFSLLPTP